MIPLTTFQYEYNFNNNDITRIKKNKETKEI